MASPAAAAPRGATMGEVMFALPAGYASLSGMPNPEWILTSTPLAQPPRPTTKEELQGSVGAVDIGSLLVARDIPLDSNSKLPMDKEPYRVRGSTPRNRGSGGMG